MSNLELTPKKNLSSFRKIALGTWRDAYDPSVYGSMALRMEEALRYIAVFRQKTGRRLTVSHMLAKAAAMVLAETPDANVVLRWNRIYLRKRIGIFLQVAMVDEDEGAPEGGAKAGEDKIDLSGVTLYDVERKPLAALLDEFEEKVAKVRARKDPALEKTRQTFRRIPYLLIFGVLRFMSFLMYTLNLDPRPLGAPKDAFGSLMITNIGSLGLDTAYVPLVPYSRVPILLAAGAVKDEPVVDRGALAVGKVMHLHATFDHRVIDGYHAAVMSRLLRRWIEQPFEHFENIG